MKKVKVTALILFLILISFTSFAAEKGDFNHLVPQYDPEKNQVIYKGEVYKFDKRGSLDKDEEKDGVKETLLEVFRHTGDPDKAITRYVTKDINWAWGIFERLKVRGEGSINNFVIIDSTGKNGFDTKLKDNEVFFLPDWVKKEVSR